METILTESCGGTYGPSGSSGEGRVVTWNRVQEAKLSELEGKETASTITPDEVEELNALRRQHTEYLESGFRNLGERRPQPRSPPADPTETDNKAQEVEDGVAVAADERQEQYRAYVQTHSYRLGTRSKIFIAAVLVTTIACAIVIENVILLPIIYAPSVVWLFTGCLSNRLTIPVDYMVRRFALGCIPGIFTLLFIFQIELVGLNSLVKLILGGSVIWVPVEEYLKFLASKGRLGEINPKACVLGAISATMGYTTVQALAVVLLIPPDAFKATTVSSLYLMLLLLVLVIWIVWLPVHFFSAYIIGLNTAHSIIYKKEVPFLKVLGITSSIRLLYNWAWVILLSNNQSEFGFLLLLVLLVILIWHTHRLRRTLPRSFFGREGYMYAFGIDQNEELPLRVVVQSGRRNRDRSAEDSRMVGFIGPHGSVHESNETFGALERQLRD
eukprot:Sspe_Gene.108142::Locus_87296_Transcript_1_1_Confidence_1.000_Length_1539::g.108142::m.108142